MTREEIDNAICDIMIAHGPDGHVDGHELITEFIMAHFNHGESVKESIEWTPWFAWHPVRLTNGTWAWMRTVEWRGGPYHQEYREAK